MTYKEFCGDWDSDKPTIACHTSGSTGAPTYIQLPKDQMIKSALRTAAYFKLNSHSHLHSCISPDFIGGKMVFVRSKVCKCSFSSEIPYNAPMINYVGPDIDLVSVVPSQMLFILDNLDRMPRISNYLIGGSQIPDILKEKILKSGVNAFESYGMTETSSHIAIRKITADNRPFKTLEGITVQELKGLLLINIEGWKSFITNDCTNIVSNKEFYITGRADNIIVSGGIKINPEQLEQKLYRYIESPFVLSSIPDDKWGEKLILVAECDAKQLEKIKITVESKLRGHEKPKGYYNIRHIPKTENGKFIRSAIRSAFLSK